MSNHHLKILIIFIVTTSCLSQGDITGAMGFVCTREAPESCETEHILRKLKKKFGPPFGKVQQNLKESLEDIYMTHAELFSKSWEKR